MPRKLPTLAGVFLAMTSLCVGASPYAQPGDAALRHDIQVLADYGVITTPVTTWPISWESIYTDIEAAEDRDEPLPAKLNATFLRVKMRAREALRRDEFRMGAQVAVAGNPTPVRSFANTPRGDGEVQAGGYWLGQRFSANVNVSYISDPVDGDELRFDGSQIDMLLGNWTFALSTMDRWWGPGWDGSLILSNNARPIPSIAIRRNITKPFETRWLNWIGPWNLDFLWGQLEKERVIPNARFFGLRFGFKPTQSLEIGISRTALWCGDGRPCGLDTFGDLLLGRDNRGDDGTTVDNEPGNQLAGFDARWTNHWFGAPVSLYGQFIGEDEAGGFPSRYLGQFGIEGSVLSRGGTSYRWYAEVAGTSCDVVKSDVRYDCAYRHPVYDSGYTHKGRIAGHGLDNDALVTSVGLIAITPDGNSWQALLRSGKLNRVGDDPDHTVSMSPNRLSSIDILYERGSSYGRFDFGIGYERREALSGGASESDVRAFLRWTATVWGY